MVGVPNELVPGILLLLPARSLLRFKSVCKYWRSLIEEPEFISEHHKTGKPYFLTHIEDDRIYRISPSSFTSLGAITAMTDEDIDLTDQLPSRNPVFILRPCNGIVCLQFHKSQDIHLWNPATKELKTLSEPNIRFPWSYSEHGWRWTEVKGFGYDFETNDYKVVIIQYTAVPPPDGFFFAHVYSLNSGSWSEIDPPGHILQSEYFRVLTGNWHLKIDGMHFWLWKNDDDFIILSFDFTSETFTTTLLPPDMSTRNLLQPDYFFILNGCIAFMNPISPERSHLRSGEPLEGDYEIWVLNEIGNKESWTKSYKFKAYSEMKLPLGNLKEDELFVKSESEELVWCAHPDPARMYHRNNRHSFTKAYAYKESLTKLESK